MDKRNHLLDEISNLLELIQEQSNVIIGYTGRIPQIELDIILENLRTLYDRLSKVSEINKEIPGKSAMAKPVVSFENEPVVQKPVVEKIIVEEPILVKEEIAKVVEEVIPPQSTFNIPDEAVNVSSIPPQVVAETLRAVAQEPLSRNTPKEPDLFSPPMFRPIEDKTSVIDKINSGIQDKSLGNQIGQKPLADIRAAIGINEKFLFLNELFNGDLQIYNNAIHQLNNAASIENARLVFSDYVKQFEWDTTNQACVRLAELVERRYL